jgi:hypothetical protein
VRKLVMAAARTLQPPPVGLQVLDELAALHRVYCTHGLSWRPSTAPGPSVERAMGIENTAQEPTFISYQRVMNSTKRCA